MSAISGTMHQKRENLHRSPRTRLALVDAGPYQAARDKDFPPHCHRTWELIYYRSGSIESIVDGVTYAGQPATIIPIPPKVVHSERARTGYSNFYLHIEAAADRNWPRVCYDDEHATFGHVCGALVREWRRAERDHTHMVALLLDQLDLLLRRVHEQAHLSSGERLVREAERLLQERSGQRVKIHELARELGVSTSFLRSHFVRLRGRTPIAHLQAVRVQHALALIRNSNAPLESVADVCGYDSASHLSRHVKRVTGASPGSLRTR